MIYNGYIFQPPKEEDFILGSSSLPIEVINSTGQWDDFLPIEEPQRLQFETYNCVSFATLSIIECLEKKLYNI